MTANLPDHSTRRLASLKLTDADAARIQALAVSAVCAEMGWTAADVVSDIEIEITESMIRGSAAVKRVSHALAAVEGAFRGGYPGRRAAEQILLSGLAA